MLNLKPFLNIFQIGHAEAPTYSITKLQKNAGIINRNRNNSASCTDNKRITLKTSEIREMAI